MEQVTMWRAFDGNLFNTEDECRNHEDGHPFLDHEQIIFYSNDGRMIEIPDTAVLIDSNTFKVFNDEALHLYINYCNGLGLRAPKPCNMAFPLHYHFTNNKWVCLEEEMAALDALLHEKFKDEFIEDEEGRHDLAIV